MRSHVATCSSVVRYFWLFISMSQIAQVINEMTMPIVYFYSGKNYHPSFVLHYFAKYCIELFD